MSDALIERLREDMAELRAEIAAQAAEIERLRAREDAAWCAGRDAAADVCALSEAHAFAVGDIRLSARAETLKDAIRALTPPETEGRG